MLSLVVTITAEAQGWMVKLAIATETVTATAVVATAAVIATAIEVRLTLLHLLYRHLD
jgi:hypothetical protein